MFVLFNLINCCKKIIDILQNQTLNMKDVKDIGLVLEGGGMRGIFTSGVLDCFMDNNLYFPYTIGVSAGSSNGLSYTAKQRGRAKYCNIGAFEHHNYIGLKYLFTQGCIMDYKFLFGDLPLKLYPFDFDTYMQGGQMTVVATNCLTGKAQYFVKPQTPDAVLMSCKASCSLPYVSPITHFEGVPYLDGGIGDPIPIRRAIADGYKKNIVVLTRNVGYKKSSMYNFLAKILYRKYPNVIEALKHAHENYNDSLAFAEQCERDGDTIIIRPQNPLTVSRLESNPEKLTALYDEGYKCAKQVIEKYFA